QDGGDIAIYGRFFGKNDGRHGTLTVLAHAACDEQVSDMALVRCERFVPYPNPSGHSGPW
ncbi:MAG TPA: hypothetical protein PLV85_21675, partial [Polyangiaceae bacterium]|nr:hypothetical protein [Polyangiaceae bacterium]